ncbi:MAG: hypothetical protein WB706_10760 [Nitrososphaeraceae archaeon]
MTNYCLALPYLPGVLELDRKFAVEECGHSKEHDEFYTIAGLHARTFGFNEIRQEVALQISK